MDEMLKKARARGSVAGREKIWSLEFADDLVIVIESERGMKEMVMGLEKYARKKKLEVNVAKTKIITRERQRVKKMSGRREKVWR
jgi:hypothetical protein